jgi:hypothetical protein
MHSGVLLPRDPSRPPAAAHVCKGRQHLWHLVADAQRHAGAGRPPHKPVWPRPRRHAPGTHVGAQGRAQTHVRTPQQRGWQGRCARAADSSSRQQQQQACANHTLAPTLIHTHRAHTRADVHARTRAHTAHTHARAPDLPAVVDVEAHAGRARFRHPVDLLVAHGSQVAREPGKLPVPACGAGHAARARGQAGRQAAAWWQAGRRVTRAGARALLAAHSGASQRARAHLPNWCVASVQRDSAGVSCSTVCQAAAAALQRRQQGLQRGRRCKRTAAPRHTTALGQRSACVSAARSPPPPPAPRSSPRS